ncbi:MAG: MFS transporter [Hyphomonadaceae bacterium]|nr:MFS transporter [Hyphomonadaceae bacterium]
MAEGASRPARTIPELPIYYLLVGCYFFAFGLQFVLFPALVAFVLGASPSAVGLAQTALTAPMFCLLLFGGLFAERAKAGPALGVLYALVAAAALVLSGALLLGQLNYTTLILYALFVGSCAAFLTPVRDAALTGVLDREAAAGVHVPIAKAAAATTAVQIGAQIVGIVVARFAGVSFAPFLALQALALAAAGACALLLRAPKPHGHESTLSGALRDLRDGVRYAFSSSVMAPMLISAAYAGVFIVGALQVLFPLVIRETYGGDARTQASMLATLLAIFWSASFVSAIVLTRLRPLERPGRALLASHILSAAALATFAIEKPFWAFALIVAGWGLAAGVNISMSRTIVQGATSPQYLGRVLAVYSMGLMGGAPVGSLITGLCADRFGEGIAALIPAAGLLIASAALAATTPLWRFTPADAAAPKR